MRDRILLVEGPETRCLAGMISRASGAEVIVVDRERLAPPQRACLEGEEGDVILSLRAADFLGEVRGFRLSFYLLVTTECLRTCLECSNEWSGCIGCTITERMREVEEEFLK